MTAPLTLATPGNAVLPDALHGLPPDLAKCVELTTRLQKALIWAVKHDLEIESFMGNSDDFGQDFVRVQLRNNGHVYRAFGDTAHWLKQRALRDGSIVQILQARRFDIEFRWEEKQINGLRNKRRTPWQ